MGSHTMDDFRAEMERRRLEDKPRRSVRRTESREVADADPSTMTIKRLAWAFGCAAKDSELESKLYRALVEKVAAILDARKEREGG